MARKRAYKKARNFGEAVLPYPGQYAASAKSVGKSAAWAVGAFTASYAAGALANGIVKKIPGLPADGVMGKVVDVVVDVLAAGLVGYAATRVAPTRSRTIYTAALTVPVLKVLAPDNPLSTLADTAMKKVGLKGWDDDLGYAWNLGGLISGDDDGLGYGPGQTLLDGMDDYASVPQERRPIPTSMGDFTSLPSVARAPRLIADYDSTWQARNAVPTSMGDFSTPGQSEHAISTFGEDLDGLSESVAAAEMM